MRRRRYVLSSRDLVMVREAGRRAILAAAAPAVVVLVVLLLHLEALVVMVVVVVCVRALVIDAALAVAPVVVAAAAVALALVLPAKRLECACLVSGPIEYKNINTWFLGKIPGIHVPRH